MNRFRKLAATTLFAATSTIAMFSVTTPATAAVAAEPCGYYEDLASAWYNHCTGQPPVSVVIRIDWNDRPDEWQCVPPGTTYLGPAGKINGAWYDNRIC